MKPFGRLVDSLSHRKRPPRNPRAVAAKIGRTKYGAKQFEEMAQEGKRMKGERMKRKPRGHKAGCKCWACQGKFGADAKKTRRRRRKR